MIKLISEKEEMQRTIKAHKAHGRGVAIVPTMGGLHDGHLSLVKQAALDCQIVIVTIYVNPTQFAVNEDLDSYPRTIEADLEKLVEQGLADIVYMPTTMYHADHATMIIPQGAAEGLEGAFRPHFFSAVATIVLKLFQHVPADKAFFGEKDYQQLAVIRQMVDDLDLPIEIKSVPTARDERGLALSSRNSYLSEEEMKIAPQLYQQMQLAAMRLQKGDAPSQVMTEAKEALLNAGFTSIDYFELRDEATLAPLSSLQNKARLLVALHLGQTRLIDNASVQELCIAQ